MTTPSDTTVVLVSGANTGIGLTVVKALYLSTKTRYHIILSSRDVSKGETALSSLLQSSSGEHRKNTISVAQLDITSNTSIKSLVEEISLEHGRLDVLVNNAGAGFDFEPQESSIDLSDRTRDIWDRSWSVNVSSTQVVTEAFVPLLLKSAAPRVLFVTSGAASLSEALRTDGPIYSRLNSSPAAGWPKDTLAMGAMAYRSVKTGLNMLMVQWHRVLKQDGVKVWAISPGFLATGLGGNSAEVKKGLGAGDPQIGGDFIRDVIEGQRDGDVGKAIRPGVVQEW